jgi:hypothetical protein
LLLATDGAGAFDELATAAGDDRLFRNADALRRRLALLADERVRVDWQEQRLRRDIGPLTDDTTVMLLRRQP